MASERDRDANVGANASVTSSRRKFLLAAGAASCVALAGSTVAGLTGQAARTRGAKPASRDVGVRALALALPVGTRLHTSTVATIHARKLGAVAVVLQRPDGSRFQVDLLRRAERDGSIAQTARLSVFAVNGGSGSSATSEPDGLAAMALARALAAAERGDTAVVGLLTHAERAHRHPSGSFRVLV